MSDTSTCIMKDIGGRGFDVVTYCPEANKDPIKLVNIENDYQNVFISLIDYELLEESDGHQFHQYQQNEQSPLILTELFGALKSDSTHHFFRNACTKLGSLRFSQFSGC